MKEYKENEEQIMKEEKNYMMGYQRKVMLIKKIMRLERFRGGKQKKEIRGKFK